MKTMKNILIIILGLFCITCSGCRKLVDVEGPTTSLSLKNVFNNDATAVGAITSLYVDLVSSATIDNAARLTTLSCIAGLSADELTYYSLAGNVSLNAYYQNNLTASNTGFPDYWIAVYQKMYVVNSAIEGLATSTGLSSAVKQQLTGEAIFMRGFYYFYLANLYGDVPLVLSTDFTVNSLIGKSDKSEVYKQIVSDLKKAQTLLSDNYLTGDGKTIYLLGSEERVRPTKWAATALLARTYLYLGDWSNAENQATAVLANTSQFHLEPLENVFLKNNNEAIWQLQPVISGHNTQDANTFILPSEGPSLANPVYLRRQLVDGFENGDTRKMKWIGKLTVSGVSYYYPNKYKVIRSSNTQAAVTEYSTVFRLAEQLLIRAEARAMQGNLSGAIQDVDKIRNRAGLSSISNTNPNINQEDLVTEILRQKRFELFTEWGHRWFDLKRIGKIDAVMGLVTPTKGNGLVWKSNQQNYPISLSELKSNPNLSPTSGY